MTIIFLAITYIAQAQELPSEPANGFAFPIGSRFVIKLIPADSVNYDYSVLSFDPFHEIANMDKSDELFEKKGEENTIVFYFCIGTSGETEQKIKEKHESASDNEELFNRKVKIYVGYSVGKRRRI